MYESPITFALQMGREIHDMLWVKLYHYVVLIVNVFSGAMYISSSKTDEMGDPRRRPF